MKIELDNSFFPAAPLRIDTMRTRIVSAPLLLVLGLLMPFGTAGQAAASDIRSWYYEGVVVNALSDIDSPLSSIQVGDSVHGYFRYDLSTEGLIETDGTVVGYSHPESFEALSAIFSNPRTGEEVSLVPNTDPGVCCPAVFVYDDWFDDFGEGPTDGLLIFQSVVSPQGSLGFLPSLYFVTDGPPTIWSGTALPTELDLADWPLAGIVFFGEFDLFEVDLVSLVPVTGVIPEPASAALLIGLWGIALPFAGRRRSRRREGR